ncbi:putative spermidine/putrescine transport system permease protein [Rhodobium orientis]|uniref:ABC transmembrane type-1 domain-containing protein n=1 Tax=Rhodobium orientis TaxID=34017 RepID=A0A327JIL1_9HYPH|nr:ABC transporter permease [Rhodobium orientis]MBB4303214.1 putative spermidine/putrescine transport system permease protein [Rhodobium orientis]MBK5951685.1 hypothetical protein [Rhodobium orientis]RAI25841.1 hypothetical protein CH339_16525 [Rhodobium orientis]
MNSSSVAARGTVRVGPSGRYAWIALTAPLAIVLLLFLVVPILSLLRASFFEGDRSFNASGVSLEHYLRFLTDSYYLNVMLDTLGYGLATALLCLVLGFPTGYALARAKPHWRRWGLIIIILPLTLSLVIVVFGWLVVLGRQGLVNQVLVFTGLIDKPIRLLFNSPAVIIVLAQQFLPFMVLSVMSVVGHIDPTLEQASANLRANRWTTFRKVIVPLSLPGILSGLTLVFVLSVSAFITPRLIGGHRVQMLGSLIYEQIIVLLNWPFGAAMSAVLFTVTLTITLIVNKWLKSHPG